MEGCQMKKTRYFIVAALLVWGMVTFLSNLHKSSRPRCLRRGGVAKAAAVVDAAAADGNDDDYKLTLPPMIGWEPSLEDYIPSVYHYQQNQQFTPALEELNTCKNIQEATQYLDRNNNTFVKSYLVIPDGRLYGANTLPIFIYSSDTDRHVSGSIARSGIWESGFVTFIAKFMETHSDVKQFIDLGTNIGVYALLIGKLFEGDRKVFAIDALAPNVERLCGSIAAAASLDYQDDIFLADTITVIHNALSDLSGQNVTLGIDRGNVGGTFVENAPNTNKVEGSELDPEGYDYGTVQTMTLDDLLQLPSFNENQPVVMKMDVEGYEARVLKGGEQFFEQVPVRAVLMEMLWQKTGQDGQDIVTFFMDRNYEPFVPGEMTSLWAVDRRRWPNDVFWLKIEIDDGEEK